MLLHITAPTKIWRKHRFKTKYFQNQQITPEVRAEYSLYLGVDPSSRGHLSVSVEKINSVLWEEVFISNSNRGYSNLIKINLKIEFKCQSE